MAAIRNGAQANSQPYRCFLLRCWLEAGAGPDGASAWRFTIQQAGRAEARRSFICFRDVAAYIDAELASCSTLEYSPLKDEFPGQVWHNQKSEDKE